MKIGFIGVGNMAGIIVSAAIKNEIFKSEEIYLFDKDVDKCKTFTANAAQSNIELVKLCDVIFLGVKPQFLDDVLTEIKGLCGEKNIVSIVAGVSCEYIDKALGGVNSIIRVMPNTPMLVNCGASAISKYKTVPDKIYSKIYQIFESCGVAVAMDEQKINHITAVNGSSPAYFYLFADIIAKWAEKNGINEKEALLLVAKTMEGSAKMLIECEKTPTELIKQVTSPNGTTQKALEKLAELGFDKLVEQALDACYQRAEELKK